MFLIIVALLAGGILAGLIQFFVDYKQLPVYEPSGVVEMQPDGTERRPGFLTRIFLFIRNHWQFFAYLVIGISGAMLVPLANELMPANLSGLANIKTPPEEKTTAYYWGLLVLAGYGIVFGYSAVRLLRSIGSLLVDRISKSQKDQETTIEELRKEIEQLKAAGLRGGQSAAAEEDENAGQSTPNSGDDLEAFEELANGPTLEAVDSCAETPKPWKIWRVAKSLAVLRQTVNTLAPSRSKLSDGAVGDLAHQTRSSDHNPWVRDGATSGGVVTAIDITHDPAGGCDCNQLAKSLEAAKDPRVKYIIWNRRIINSSAVGDALPWTWRPYTGTNPHNKHLHVSVKCEVASYDAAGAWTVGLR